MHVASDMEQGTWVTGSPVTGGCGTAMRLAWWARLTFCGNTIEMSLARQASLLSVSHKGYEITFHSERSPAFSRGQISPGKVLPFL